MANCPYFRSATSLRIRCKRGTERHRELAVTKRSRHLERYCGKNYTQCRMYMRIEKDADEKIRGAMS